MINPLLLSALLGICFSDARENVITGLITGNEQPVTG
jgi:hypothetical protein